MRNTGATFLIVVAGGIVGTTARWATIEAAARLGLSNWSYLLFVNLVGAFVLGWYIGRARTAAVHPNAIAFVAVGVLGSFTTFSGFAVESVLSTDGRSPALGLALALASVVLGVLVAAMGRVIAR
jgi:CrcB protein